MPAATIKQRNMSMSSAAGGNRGQRGDRRALILINTVGGDVEAGFAIAEMIALLSKPTVSLVAWRKPFYRSSAGCLG